ncbi:hypothetical protein [Rhodococcus sp. HNM0569]|uniref:hypothetical protein n=1 Tax=Rhodococcus sp. HNM0569 TaxID=2716340 RepID=UPI00146E276F|nr:hypothetical protein [Rhodococcus sp. HNM0569]NLU81624.1 hypothetical protein [Rhodococcus sp. HNM0569]
MSEDAARVQAVVDAICNDDTEHARSILNRFERDELLEMTLAACRVFAASAAITHPEHIVRTDAKTRLSECEWFINTAKTFKPSAASFRELTKDAEMRARLLRKRVADPLKRGM